MKLGQAGRTLSDRQAGHALIRLPRQVAARNTNSHQSNVTMPKPNASMYRIRIPVLLV